MKNFCCDRHHDKHLPPKTEEAFGALVKLMDLLRSEKGCPWDRKQTQQTLKPYLLEETYELLEAMDEGPDRHCEELGDLLLQIVFQAQIAKEAGEFTIVDVVQGIYDKLVRRHPHIFGETEANTPEQVVDQWTRIKAQEKARQRQQDGAQDVSASPPPSALTGIPKTLPGLARANQASLRAAKVGFDWPESGPVYDKIEEEIEEVREAVAEEDPEHIAAEVGDLLFAVTNLARHLGVDPEVACQAATTRFIKRFGRVEKALAERGKTPSQSDLEEMESLWRKAKLG